MSWTLKPGSQRFCILVLNLCSCISEVLKGSAETMGRGLSEAETCLSPAAFLPYLDSHGHIFLSYPVAMESAVFI